MESKETKETPKKPCRVASIGLALFFVISACVKSLWFTPMTEIQGLSCGVAVIIVALWELFDIIAWEKDKEVTINNLSIQVVKNGEEEGEE